jgi:hypothetical protein
MPRSAAAATSGPFWPLRTPCPSSSRWRRLPSATNVAPRSSPPGLRAQRDAAAARHVEHRRAVGQLRDGSHAAVERGDVGAPRGATDQLCQPRALDIEVVERPERTGAHVRDLGHRAEA